MKSNGEPLMRKNQFPYNLKQKILKVCKEFAHNSLILCSTHDDENWIRKTQTTQGTHTTHATQAMQENDANDTSDASDANDANDASNANDASDESNASDAIAS